MHAVRGPRRARHALRRPCRVGMHGSLSMPRMRQGVPTRKHTHAAVPGCSHDETTGTRLPELTVPGSNPMVNEVRLCQGLCSWFAGATYRSFDAAPCRDDPEANATASAHPWGVTAQLEGQAAGDYAACQFAAVSFQQEAAGSSDLVPASQQLTFTLGLVESTRT